MHNIPLKSFIDGPLASHSPAQSVFICWLYFKYIQIKILLKMTVYRAQNISSQSLKIIFVRLLCYHQYAYSSYPATREDNYASRMNSFVNILTVLFSVKNLTFNLDMANIVLLLVIVMLVFSVIGITIFKNVIPKHFGDLSNGILFVYISYDNLLVSLFCTIIMIQ